MWRLYWIVLIVFYPILYINTEKAEEKQKKTNTQTPQKRTKQKPKKWRNKEVSLQSELVTLSAFFFFKAIQTEE